MLARRQAIRENRQKGETPDPTPVEIPGKMQRPLSLREEMKRFIREELSKGAESVGVETFEEADDFEEDDPDIELTTGYTVTELQAVEPIDDLNGDPSADSDNSLDLENEARDNSVTETGDTNAKPDADPLTDRPTGPRSPPQKD